MTAVQIARLPTAASARVRQPALRGHFESLTLPEMRAAGAKCVEIQAEIDHLLAYLDGYVCGVNGKVAELRQAKARAMRVAMGEIK